MMKMRLHDEGKLFEALVEQAKLDKGQDFIWEEISETKST